MFFGTTKLTENSTMPQKSPKQQRFGWICVFLVNTMLTSVVVDAAENDAIVARASAPRDAARVDHSVGVFTGAPRELWARARTRLLELDEVIK